jgi:hypothetical protein
MTDNNDSLQRSNQNGQNAASRRFYSRCYSQFVNAAILNCQRNSCYSSTTTNDGDNHLQWIVPTTKLRKSNTQSFHILDTPSRSLPEPCLHLTGSCGGNEYMVKFASNSISCRCDDTPNPCKHALFIVQRLGIKVKSGLNLKQDSGYGADIGANIGGTFFSRVFLPQKWDDLPPF